MRLLEKNCKIEDFDRLIKKSNNEVDYSNCNYISDTIKNVPIYDCEEIYDDIVDGNKQVKLLNEWAEIFKDKSGVIVLKGAFKNLQQIDDVSRVFNEIIEIEKLENETKGDHFAKAGANIRVWNALEKLCLRDDKAFINYYKNPFIAAISEAWLGINYQITSQVNLVKPGGAAQDPHRDYHLGFQNLKDVVRYPLYAHKMSQFLTLQGAVAHIDMPLESGPTKFLPFSQKYDLGYIAWQREDFKRFFEAQYIQLPLQKGDCVFFNPALFHAAGANLSPDIQRLGNLLQISSSMGRAMESVDRLKMVKVIYPTLLSLKNSDNLEEIEIDNILSTTAEGYAFPNNLDKEQPVDGMIPISQKQLVRKALYDNWEFDKFCNEIDKHSDLVNS